MRALTGAMRSGLLDKIFGLEGWQVMTYLLLWSGLSPFPRSLRRAPQIAVSCVIAANLRFPIISVKNKFVKNEVICPFD